MISVKSFELYNFLPDISEKGKYFLDVEISNCETKRLNLECYTDFTRLVIKDSLTHDELTKNRKM